MREIGVILYPHKDISIDETERYLKLAKSYGYTRVVATFFAVEYEELKNPVYLDKIKAIGNICKNLSLPLQADLFPIIFENVGATVENVQPLIDLGITEFRMDYGFTMKDLGIISKNSGVHKIILNASTAAENPKQFDTDLEIYVSAGGDLNKLEASHNVNPHPETGISIESMKEIRDVLSKHNIPICAWAPAKEYTYGIYDVWESCPTVEDHRYWMAFESAQELWAADVADLVCIGDAFASETELKLLSEMKETSCIQIRIKPAYELSELEKKILFSEPLQNRLAEYVLRFTKFRNTNILPRNCVDVKKYDVTIDNQTVKRYNGEIRIALRDQRSDRRVNVVGHVNEHDIRLLSYVKSGTKIKFVQE